MPKTFPHKRHTESAAEGAPSQQLQQPVRLTAIPPTKTSHHEYSDSLLLVKVCQLITGLSACGPPTNCAQFSNGSLNDIVLDMLVVWHPETLKKCTATIPGTKALLALQKNRF